ncbi:snare-like protein [Metschnikowia bicuspidata]|uniref:Coatomer subunit zeta n=1 Tax=Metschnikowia bicuspidata TaxID=27322 RepID=A0A4P9ZAM8_9ASCO|nr:snare-like protein [Metschnikowia bicuspidata]
MSLNITLYTVTAALILGPDGERLYAKYYRPDDALQAYKTVQQQEKFEKTVYAKINKLHQDVLLCDDHLVTYKQTNNVIVVMVGALQENESMLYSLTANVHEALSILFNNSLDKQTVLEKYDMVCLCLDEAVEDGIIVEIDPYVLVSRVTKPPQNSVVAGEMSIDLSEKGFFNAFSYASKRISEKLQQGL